MPFTDPMLDIIAGKDWYCFLDGYFGYSMISIALEDYENTTFTCPYDTFAFKWMSFWLCNAPDTFQRCITFPFFRHGHGHYGGMYGRCFCSRSFFLYECLLSISMALHRCEEANLVLNWVKCHFMLKEGIFLGHKVLVKGIEVDKANIDVIEKLSLPIWVKGVQSFLGHAKFYRCFMK